VGRVLRPTRAAQHIIGHFRDESFQALQQWRRSVINLVATSLLPSILSSLPSSGLSRGLSRTRSPAAKHSDAIYTDDFIKSTLMIKCTTEISVHAEFSHWIAEHWYRQDKTKIN